jgi:hypothetical protein
MWLVPLIVSPTNWDSSLGGSWWQSRAELSCLVPVCLQKLSLPGNVQQITLTIGVLANPATRPHAGDC